MEQSEEPNKRQSKKSPIVSSADSCGFGHGVPFFVLLGLGVRSGFVLASSWFRLSRLAFVGYLCVLSGVADVLLRGAFNSGGQVQDFKGVCVFWGCFR